eukprot:GHVP01038041.1.p2 GENE.GHVP01038041.1~~GHVP01038041.1.p2  ORF type:complete len:266 (+),score=42.34 GHVP01038041.1:1116-1913(+)
MSCLSRCENRHSVILTILVSSCEEISVFDSSVFLIVATGGSEGTLCFTKLEFNKENTNFFFSPFLCLKFIPFMGSSLAITSFPEDEDKESEYLIASFQDTSIIAFRFDDLRSLVSNIEYPKELILSNIPGPKLGEDAPKHILHRPRSLPFYTSNNNNDGKSLINLTAKSFSYICRPLIKSNPGKIKDINLMQTEPLYHTGCVEVLCSYGDQFILSGGAEGLLIIWHLEDGQFSCKQILKVLFIFLLINIIYSKIRILSNIMRTII